MVVGADTTVEPELNELNETLKAIEIENICLINLFSFTHVDDVEVDDATGVTVLGKAVAKENVDESDFVRFRAVLAAVVALGVPNENLKF